MNNLSDLLESIVKIEKETKRLREIHESLLGYDTPSKGLKQLERGGSILPCLLSDSNGQESVDQKDKQKDIVSRIIDVYIRERKKHDPGFRIRSEKKWKADAKKLANLGYSLEDLEELIKFALSDVQNTPSGWKGWADRCKNLEMFRRHIGKIEAQMENSQNINKKATNYL